MDFTTAILCIGLISFIMLVIEVNYTYASQGTAYGWSANRPSVEISPLGQRTKMPIPIRLKAYPTPCPHWRVAQSWILITQARTRRR